MPSPIRLPLLVLLAAGLGPASAAAQDLTFTVSPSETNVNAGAVVGINIEFTNSDAPSTGLGSMNLALSVAGPGLPVVIGQPVFPGNWPVVTGQPAFTVVQDGAGGFTQITAARFDPGSPTPLVNPPVAFRYNVLLPQSGVYTFTLTPRVGQGAMVGLPFGLPIEPDSVTLNGAVVQTTGSQTCNPSAAYTLDGSVALVTLDGGSGDPEYAVEIDLVALDDQSTPFDVIVRDPLGNSFDGASPETARVVFDDRAAFESYITTTLAQPGWTVTFSDPSLIEGVQTFIAQFITDADALDDIASGLPDLVITAPADGASIAPGPRTLAWSPAVLAAPAGVALTGVASVSGSGGFSASAADLASDAGSVAFAESIPVGPAEFEVRYASAASAATPAFDLVITSDCSVAGQAEITANTVAESVAALARSAVTVEEPAGCSPADLVPPFGILDLDDADAFINAFIATDPAADLVPPFGVVDLDDVDAFIIAFLAGCP